MTDAKRCHRGKHVLGDIDVEHSKGVQRTVFQGIRLVFCLGQIFRSEGAAVDDKQTALHQIPHIGHQRRRIHGNEHIEGITGSSDILHAKINLEGRDTEGGAYGRTNLRGKIGKG